MHVSQPNASPSAMSAIPAMDFWTLAEALRLTKPAEDLHDATLGWINRNHAASLQRVMDRPRMVEASKLRLYWRHILGREDFSAEAGSVEGFRAAMAEPLRLWRGGGGVYDPLHRPARRNWVSFTAVQRRANTFSRYDGTCARRLYRLPERDRWWIAEVEVTLGDALLYLDAGFDEEVILPLDLARRARVIETSHDGR